MSFISVLVWIAATVILVMAKRPFNLYLTELNCSRHAEPNEVFQCSHHNVKYRTFIDGFLIMSKDVNAFQMRAFAEIVRAAGDAPMKLFDFTSDGCHLLDVAGGNNILKVTLDYMRKSGNIPERCPLVAKENYSLTNFYVDADMLPSYTPECTFNLEFSLMIGPKLITLVKTKGKIESKKQNKF